MKFRGLTPMIPIYTIYIYIYIFTIEIVLDLRNIKKNPSPFQSTKNERLLGHPISFNNINGKIHLVDIKLNSKKRGKNRPLKLIG